MIESSSSGWEVFKEPKGFIKVIEVLIAICAFATTCDFSTSVKLKYVCQGNGSYTNWGAKFTYPFNIDSIVLPQCNAAESKHMYGNFAAAAQFYVFVGVLTMLFCVAMGVYYVYFHDRYFADSRFSKYEFIFSIVIVLLWFIASCAWADNVNQFKKYTLVSRICNEVKPNMHCEATEQATYGGLNASLIFGFTNVALWVAGLWFIWKETPWSGNNSLLGPENIATAADGSQM
ncbi:putative synaptophysin/synaptoporin [Schistosoma mansoni]|uniref:Putative synaptophysin/synaptoporin n=1 Tax=Schistosoma mansoni TaxID=6183 RepID=G4VJM9_SCHMA|nr:putative synaptophysin/synaptoporin [Schistosoma mansoni]|eukprot:XP_018652234.1 putative synaptophysin/synaptoporin [Schistosoma mansoni]